MQKRYEKSQIDRLISNLRSANYSPEDLDKLCSADHLAEFKKVLTGTAEIYDHVFVIDRTTPIRFDEPDEWFGRGLKIFNPQGRKPASLQLTKIDLDKVTIGKDKAGSSFSTPRAVRYKNVPLDHVIAWRLFRERGQRALQWLWHNKGFWQLEFTGDSLIFGRPQRIILECDKKHGGSWRYYSRYYTVEDGDFAHAVAFIKSER